MKRFLYNSPLPIAAKNFRITGRVQGVFFRAETEAKATTLGITGFVENKSDGSMFIHAEGTDDALSALEQWCHKGPELAVITDVLSKEIPEEGFPLFTIRQ